jgi:murein DD-endopeptidase MepM/ murein hydrolase activator NlpD
MPHNGVDFAAPIGTPVYSAASGVVQSVGDGGPCGNMIQVKHASGLVSAYCHMSRFAQGVHPGQHVEARQLIGYVGQTGRVTGAHLHFAVKRGEMFIDPLALKLDGVKILPKDEREDFDKSRVELDGVLDGIMMSAPPASVSVAPAADAGVEDNVMDDMP